MNRGDKLWVLEAGEWVEASYEFRIEEGEPLGHHSVMLASGGGRRVVCSALTLTVEPAAAKSPVAELVREREEARDWVRRLTAETRVLTCVYCGHAYPPGSPEHGAEVLTEHIKACEKHPMRDLQQKADRLALLEGALLFLKGGRSPDVYIERATELGWKPPGAQP